MLPPSAHLCATSLPPSVRAAAADELKQIREKLEEKYQAVRA